MLQNEMLFKGYWNKETYTAAFTGFTLRSMMGSITPDDLFCLIICPWTGLQDWRGHNIYEDDILHYWSVKDGKEFVGRVQYEPQLGAFIVKSKNRFINITDMTGMSGGADGIRLSNAELVGNMYHSPNQLNRLDAVQVSDTTEDDSSNAAD